MRLLLAIVYDYTSTTSFSYLWLSLIPSSERWEYFSLYTYVYASYYNGVPVPRDDHVQRCDLLLEKKSNFTLIPTVDRYRKNRE